MIIKWVTNIASRSPILEQVHLTHMTPYNAKKITDNKKLYLRHTLDRKFPTSKYPRYGTFDHKCWTPVSNYASWWSGVVCLKQKLCILPMTHTTDCTSDEYKLLCDFKICPYMLRGWSKYISKAAINISISIETIELSIIPFRTFLSPNACHGQMEFNTVKRRAITLT